MCASPSGIADLKSGANPVAMRVSAVGVRAGVRAHAMYAVPSGRSVGQSVGGRCHEIRVLRAVACVLA